MGREPKGTPAGGQFAKGKRKRDVSDLTGERSAFDDANPMADSMGFVEVKGREGARRFHERISELKKSNPFAAAVDVHDPDEYERCRMFLTEDGRAGFAIAEGDELVSVFSYRGKHAGDAIVSKAVEMGARRLDCYDIDGALPRLYGRHGFKPVAYVDWDDDYAPDDWDYGLFGRPRVAAMILTDADVKPVEHVPYDKAIDMARRLARR